MLKPTSGLGFKSRLLSITGHQFRDAPCSRTTGKRGGRAQMQECLRMGGSLWRGEHQTLHPPPGEVIYCKGKGVFILLQCSPRRLGVCNRKSRKRTAAPQGRDRWGQSGLTEPNLVGRQRGALSWQSSVSAEEEFAFSHTQEYTRSKYFIFSSFPLKGKS